MVNILKSRYAGRAGPSVTLIAPPTQWMQVAHPPTKRQRFEPKEGMSDKTSWGVMDHSEFNPNGWAVLAHMSLGGEASVRLPGETQDVCRIKLVEGNDERIKLDIADLKRTNRMQVTLFHSETKEITANGTASTSATVGRGRAGLPDPSKGIPSTCTEGRGSCRAAASST